MTPLLSHIPRGRANATSILAIRAATGLSDREVRAEIERLILEERVPVCTLPTNPGVWIAETAEEWHMARAHLMSKLVALRHRIDAGDAAARATFWRPTLFEVDAK